MDKELQKQRIRSIVEQSGYFDVDTEPIIRERWWKWLAGLAVITLFSHFAIDLLSR